MPRTKCESYESQNGLFLFEMESGPILSSINKDKWQEDLKLPLPDIVFGDNKLRISVRSDRNGPWTPLIEFNTKDALTKVLHEQPTFISPPLSRSSHSSLPSSNNSDIKIDNDDDRIQFSFAKAWKASRSEKYLRECLPSYDWTFTSNYDGSILCLQYEKIRIEKNEDDFDRSLLMKRDPILYLSGFFLYEDEMGDNGTTVFSIKIRVMPTCFLVLARCFLKIDKVILRSIETRIMGYTVEDDTLTKNKTYSLFKDISSKEIRWESNASFYHQLEIQESEWLSIQSDHDFLSSKLPILKLTKEKLLFNIS